ncbi:hypothetical protein EJ02DRAFT_453217 [Clathrospora elynae]|uniref:Uncharacterized protein n=1 Tax=Clathrospora elynae TaxID=706981 RepID=A0A6A5SS80_9PLEO|nr:hypothetical protein EJ02DRAFT_453217 [Clathrospora elynae]
MSRPSTDTALLLSCVDAESSASLNRPCFFHYLLATTVEIAFSHYPIILSAHTVFKFDTCPRQDRRPKCLSLRNRIELLLGTTVNSISCLQRYALSHRSTSVELASGLYEYAGARTSCKALACDPSRISD